MILREIEKSTIYIAHLMGYDENGEPIYTKPIRTKAQISQNTRGEIVTATNGISELYDLKLTIEKNKTNVYIDEHTIFWVNTSAIDKGHNYEPIKISIWDKDLKVIHLKGVQMDWDSVWCHSERIGFYEIQCHFDENNSNLRLPIDSFFNKTITTKIWKEKPESVEDKNSLYLVEDYYQLQDEMIYVLVKGD